MRNALVESKGEKSYMVKVGTLVIPVIVMHDKIDGKTVYSAMVDYRDKDNHINASTTGGSMKELKKNLSEALQLALDHNEEQRRAKTPLAIRK